MTHSFNSDIPRLFSLRPRGKLLLLALSFYAALSPAQLKLPGTPPRPASQQPPQPAPAASSAAIPLPQIADQAEALDLKLEEISSALTTRPGGNNPNAIPPNQSADIVERAVQVDSLLQTGPDLSQLREEIVYWRALSRTSGEQRKLLTDRADELQAQISLLTQEQSRWQATHDQLHDTTGIEVVAARVQHELDSLRDIRLQAQAQLNQVLIQQNELSETGRRIADTLAKLTEAEARFRISIFAQDGPPLWSRNALGGKDQPMEILLHRTASQEFATGAEFLRARGGALLWIPFFYLVSVVAAFRLKRYLNSPTGASAPALAHAVFGRPYVIALLATLLLSVAETQSAPLSILAVGYVLWLGLIFRLTPILAPIETRPLIYLLLAINLLEILRSATPLSPVARRILLPLIILAVIVAFGWLLRPSRFAQLRLSKWTQLVLKTASRAALLVMAIALVANICGFVSLSRILGAGTVFSAFFATALYFVVRVLLLAVDTLLESPWLRTLPTEIHAAIRLWSVRLLVLIAVIVWCTRSELYVFLFRDSLQGAASSVFDFAIDLGAIHFTVGDVLIVLLILVIGFALSKGVSSLLRSVLVARFPLQRGMPYAASKVSYYILCVLVLFAAVGAAGVDLNKFTVITGAVGVGVGFGLQNIVNNFASGLILLFERPIRVDDTVEVNGLIGTVKRIGARSSTIVTGQGAEVIVPNSNLVSSQVINWTLSSPQRRIDIPVGVAYGTDPQTVIDLLVSEAASQEGVMTDPAPAAFFMDFGDSALNFELRFWSARQDIWFQLRSDVTVGVARALAEAEIEVPFPQRDLHLRSVDASIMNQPLPPQIANAIPNSGTLHRDEVPSLKPSE